MSRVGRRSILSSWQLYVMLALPLAYLAVFKYSPMYGAQIAFRTFRAADGIWGSPWVGLLHFRRFVTSPIFLRVVGNTFFLSLYGLIVGFPIPIVLAICLSYVKHASYKKTIQLVTYAPYFISVVVMAGIIIQFLSVRGGPVNLAIRSLGGRPVNFMAQPGLFRSIFVWSDVWQQAGYGAIIYLAALSAVDPELHSAAIVDGASKIQRIRHVDFPGILPTAVILLVLNTGRIFEVGFEKVLLLQNPLNLRTAEVIDTYVYKTGIAAALPNFSYTAAIGLFKSLVGLVLLLIVNRFARTLTETSLW